jgi:hypothetical protein
MMALIIGVPMGKDFYVGETRIEVIDITDELNYRLRVGSQEFDISDDCSVEVLPEVLISAGKRGGSDIARIAIQAPKRIPIRRGNVPRRRG